MKGGYPEGVQSWCRVKGVFRRDMRKIRDITYTPDFTHSEGNILYIIECKGFADAVYPVKKKLFLEFLKENKDFKDMQVYFFEVKSLGDASVALRIMKGEVNE